MPKWRRMLRGTRPSCSGPGSMSSSATTSYAFAMPWPYTCSPSGTARLRHVLSCEQRPGLCVGCIAVSLSSIFSTSNYLTWRVYARDSLTSREIWNRIRTWRRQRPEPITSIGCSNSLGVEASAHRPGYRGSSPADPVDPGSSSTTANGRDARRARAQPWRVGGSCGSWQWRTRATQLARQACEAGRPLERRYDESARPARKGRARQATTRSGRSPSPSRRADRQGSQALGGRSAPRRRRRHSSRPRSTNASSPS